METLLSSFRVDAAEYRRSTRLRSMSLPYGQRQLSTLN